MKERVLYQHLRGCVEELRTQAKRVATAEHSTVKGRAREHIAQTFLARTLPSLIEFHCGSEIVDRNELRSGEVDIAFHSRISPKMNLSGDNYVLFADSVLGAMEVKSSLTTGSMAPSTNSTSELRRALDKFRRIKAMARKSDPRFGERTVPGRSQTPCFLFAFSGPPADTLEEKILEYGRANTIDLKEFCPDVTIVLDPPYSVLRNDEFIYPSSIVEHDKPFIKDEGDKDILVHLVSYLTKTIEQWTAWHSSFDFGPYCADLSSGDGVGAAQNRGSDDPEA